MCLSVLLVVLRVWVLLVLGFGELDVSFFPRMLIKYWISCVRELDVYLFRWNIFRSPFVVWYTKEQSGNSVLMNAHNYLLVNVRRLLLYRFIFRLLGFRDIYSG